MSMRGFWFLLLLLLAIPPLILPFRPGSSWRDSIRKSALQVVSEVVPPRFRLVFAVMYLALIMFVLGKLKGVF